MPRRLVQIDDDGKPRHEEKEEDYPELLYASATSPCLPEQTEQTEQEWQTVENVVPLVGFQLVGQQILVAIEHVVDERNARNPVAVFGFSEALQVVLASGKVPKEVSPVHKVALIRQEEAHVLHLCGHLHAVYVVPLNASHNLFVVLCVCIVPHTREEHVLFEHLRSLVPHKEISVRLVWRCLFLAFVNRFPLLDFVVSAVFCHLWLAGISLSVELRRVLILVACKVTAEREDVFRRVLIHWRVRRRAYYDFGIRCVSDYHHEHTEQRGVLHASRNEQFLATFHIQHEVENRKNDDSDDECRPPVAYEWNTNQCESYQESNVLSAQIAVLVRLGNSPNEAADEQQDVENGTRVERHTERIGKQKLEKSPHSNNARHYAPEHCGYQNDRYCERNERPFEVRIGHTLVVINQNNGRNA